MREQDHIDLLVEERNVPKLQELAHDPDKVTAKYARKGLHILRTRGVDAPVPPKRPQVVLSSGRILGGLGCVVVDAPRSSMSELIAAGHVELAPLIVSGLIRRRRKKVEDPR